MERLTKYQPDNFYDYGDDQVSDELINEWYYKLQCLEDIEEEIECPLEIVYKALYKGFFCDKFVIHKDNYADYPEKWEQWRKEDDYKLQQIGHSKYLNFNPWYNIIYFEYGESYYMEVWLRDYKKTWWLRENKSE